MYVRAQVKDIGNNDIKYWYYINELLLVISICDWWSNLFQFSISKYVFIKLINYIKKILSKFHQNGESSQTNYMYLFYSYFNFIIVGKI